MSSFIRAITINVIANLVAAAIVYGLGQLVGLLPPNEVAQSISAVVAAAFVVAVIVSGLATKPNLFSRLERILEVALGALFTLIGLLTFAVGSIAEFLPGDRPTQFFLLVTGVASLFGGIGLGFGRSRVRQALRGLTRKDYS